MIMRRRPRLPLRLAALQRKAPAAEAFEIAVVDNPLDARVLKFDRGDIARLQRRTVFGVRWMAFGRMCLGLKGPFRP